jgi:hypothetical protein
VKRKQPTVVSNQKPSGATMTLPISTNTTCDIYRSGVIPPAAAAMAGVPCFLQCDWRGGQEGGDRLVNSLTWTHFMLIDASVDIRDAYVGRCATSQQDTVFIPDQTATQYTVIFIEHVQRGTAHAHKRVFLDRRAPNWPTNDL